MLMSVPIQLLLATSHLERRFPRGGLRYSSGYSDSSSLPKLKLNKFDGNPHEWPEWSSMLQWINAQYQTQKRWANWRLYWQAKQGQQSLEWAILDKSMLLHGAFWRAILGGLLWSLMHNWRFFTKQVGNLQSSWKLYMAVETLPQVLKEKWCFYVDDKNEDWLDLIMFGKLLSRIAFEEFSAFKGERREEDRRGIKSDKRFSKTSNFSLWNLASSNVK